MTSPLESLRYVLAGLACSLSVAAVAAPTQYEVVHNIGTDIVFRSFTTVLEGNAPPVLGRDGKLVGMLASYKNGLHVDPVLGLEVHGWVCELYSLDPQTKAYTRLAEIDSASLRYGSPEPGPSVGTSKICSAPTQAADGNWYGTTFAGGDNHGGKIWRYTPGGQVETLYSFPGAIGDSGYVNAGSAGAFPATSLVQAPDGLFYGTTTRGGAFGVGTMYGFDPASGLTVWRDFPAVTGMSVRASSLLTLSADKARVIGALNTAGNTEVFSLALATHTYSTFFTGALSSPTGLAEAPTGDWYLTNYDGNFYRYEAASGRLTNTSSLAANGTPYGGVAPNGLLLAADGNFYGTIQYGGANASGFSNSNNTGSIFRLKQDGSYEIIHMLAALSNGTLPEGAFAVGGLVKGPDDRFFGIATAGGTNSHGAIFSVIPGDPIAPQVLLTLTGSGPNTTVPNYPDPYTIVLGQSAAVRWSSVQAESCVAGSSWPTPGAIEANGVLTLTPAAAGKYLYTIVCNNAEVPGQILTASLSLTVLAVQPASEAYGSGGGGSFSLAALLGLALCGVCANVLRARRRSTFS